MAGGEVGPVESIGSARLQVFIRQFRRQLHVCAARLIQLWLGQVGVVQVSAEQVSALLAKAAEARAWAREAMACGVPVVAGGAGEVELITAATGFPAGPAGLVPALRAAAGDPAGCARRGAAARAALTAHAL